MRGTPQSTVNNAIQGGIIPAYAGNTLPFHPSRRRARDHPRVCGEHEAINSADALKKGSSPRMRGTLDRDIGIIASRGIIPAYAGNTEHAAHQRHQLRDHPRVCGEHVSVGFVSSVKSGSSPRMRGTPQSTVNNAIQGGIIPAYAGNTTCHQSPQPWRRDHPRVCGEHPTATRPRSRATGSSPRMRGTQSITQSMGASYGIIPAYAGNTRRSPFPSRLPWDHPRVCGEHTKNPSSESRNPIIELHFNQFAKKVKRCFAIRFRPMRCFIFKVQ